MIINCPLCVGIVWHHYHSHHQWYVWTVFLATGLITETLHLAHTCTYAPSTWIIKSTHVFCKYQPDFLNFFFVEPMSILWGHWLPHGFQSQGGSLACTLNCLVTSGVTPAFPPIGVALLTTWLSLEPSYLAKLCTCPGATHTRNYAAVNNILKTRKPFSWRPTSHLLIESQTLTIWPWNNLYLGMTLTLVWPWPYLWLYLRQVKPS